MDEHDIERDEDERPDEEAGPTRRDFLARIGIGACAVAAAGSGLVTLRYLQPEVLFEPPTNFRAGTPLDYSEGTARFFKEQKAYVIGGQGGVYALSAVCTHLGCITRLHADENAIACPCHGSRFDLEGNVTHGPAPRPLNWIEVKVEQPSGVLVVDTAVVVPQGTVVKT